MPTSRTTNGTEAVTRTSITPVQTQILPNAWHLLLLDALRLVPQAQALTLWSGRPGEPLRFQHGLGFEAPQAFLQAQLEPDHPVVQVGRTDQFHVWDETQTSLWKDETGRWRARFREAQGPQETPPRYTLAAPWPYTNTLFLFHAWEAPPQPPTREAWNTLLERFRSLGVTLAAWSDFYNAVGRAVRYFPRLLTTKPEDFMETALRVFRTMLPYDRASAWLREGKEMVVKATAGVSREDIPLGLRVSLEDSRILKRLAETGKPLWLPTGQPVLDDSSPTGGGSWLGLPLYDAEQRSLQGLVILERDIPHGFLGDEIRIGAQFAQTLTTYLDYNRAFHTAAQTRAELTARTRQLEALYRLSEALTQTLDPVSLWEQGVQHLHRAVNASRTLAWEADPKTLQWRAQAPEATNGAPKPTLASEHLEPLLEYLREGRAFQTCRPQEEAWLQPLLDLLSQPTGTVLLVPAGQGDQFQGFFWLERERRFLPEEIALAQVMARHIGTALHNAHLFQVAQRLTQELENRIRERTQALQREQQRAQLLARVFAELAGALDLEQILNRTLEALLDGLNLQQALVVVARPDEPNLFWRAGRGRRQPKYGGEATTIPLNDPVAQVLLTKRTPMVIPDTDAYGEDLSAWWDYLGQKYRSLIAVPLLVGAESLGGLVLLRDRPGEWDPDDVDMLQTIGMQMATAIQNAELFNIIQEQAQNLGALFRQQQIEAQRAKAILEAVADGILVTDARMRITLLNPSAERLLGIQASQVLGKPLEHFRGLFGSAGARWLENIQRWSQAPENLEEAVAESQIEMEDGRVLSVRLAPVFLHNEFLGTVSVIRDITQHIEIDRMKSAFVANVSHELRTPLTAIKGYAEILLKGRVGELDERQRKFLNIIHRHTERLIVLVNDLLDLSRLEAGRVRLHPEQVDLRELIRDTMRDFRQKVKKDGRDLTLTYEIPEDLPPVYADVKRTAQILNNLVENAIRYTPDGGSVHVRARVTEDGQFVEVAVKDTGVGIPPEEQDRVFERFYRGQNTLVMETPGTGLGLSIVKQLVEMQGGRIWLESTGVPGEGTTFYFTLPVFTGQEPLPESWT